MSKNAIAGYELTQDMTRFNKVIQYNGLPPVEKWKGLELAKTVGKNGYTVDSFIEDTKKQIGYETWCSGSTPDKMLSPTLTEWQIREQTLSWGDDNPLYTDPAYAAKTRYGCLLGPPVMLMWRKYSLNRGVIAWGPYPLSSLQGGWSWEWNDVIRVGDRWRVSSKLKDVYVKKGRTGRLVFMITDLSFWNHHDDLCAIGGGSFICPGRDETAEDFKKGKGLESAMLYERPAYHYSEEEIDKIVKSIEAEDRRGAKPRYWEDVEVGDKPTPVVKGVMTFTDFLAAGTHGTDQYGAFELGYYSGRKQRVRTNPLTNWPYEHVVMEHYDFNLCRMRGLPGPFDVGGTRVASYNHLLSNWMGDDGFLRRLSTQIRKPKYYGDTTYFYAEITKKYVDTVEGKAYAAVDLSLSAINQVEENSLPGKATIYLPSRELGEVELPVPPLSEEKFPLMNTSSNTPRMITQRNVKDFVKEIDSGETIFPNLAGY